MYVDIHNIANMTNRGRNRKFIPYFEEIIRKDISKLEDIIGE